ncbi:MATE family efflux transporter [Deinococcus yavapaiensis]|uniref:Multidrug-efflux transporter n=1 Tax=Deinococcus yavapaiensis KR-236 TaxID=694435 RepID=A0A318S6E3_9DEIO|nr:MATE family efflux transporter [Deinococcus yavapaiensis]PYE49960.1 putative MATE family efflux protein [Deinococcus yavapaiensis KR-236]
MSAETNREIARIALPVSLESMVQLVLNFTNQVVVGTLGTATIAAVGLSNNALFIGIACLNVVGSGCAILASRARGRGDEDTLGRIALLSVLFAVLLALLLTVPIALSGSGFLRFVGASDEIAGIGGPYLGLYALALPLVTANVVMTSTFRTIGRARLPLIVTLSSLTLTPLLAWLLVTQLGWGVIGAAAAIVMTQSLRTALLAGFLFFSRFGIRVRLPTFSQGRGVFAEMAPLVLPLFVTEIVFSSGVFLFSLLVGRIGTAQLAAFQIVATFENIFVVGAVGFNTAATILTGRAIGQANAREVWRWSGGVWRLGVLVGLGLGVLFAASTFLIGALFPNTTPEVRQLAQWGALLNALFLPVKVANMIGFGTLASGGDTRYLLLSDVVTVVLVGLPFAYLLAFPAGLGLWGVFLGRLLGEEMARIVMLVWRYRTGAWFKLEPRPNPTD